MIKTRKPSQNKLTWEIARNAASYLKRGIPCAVLDCYDDDGKFIGVDVIPSGYLNDISFTPDYGYDVSYKFSSWEDITGPYGDSSIATISYSIMQSQ